MNRCFGLVIILLLVSMAFIAGCSNTPETPPSGTPEILPSGTGMDYASLVNSLRQAGATVELIGDASYPRPIFSAPASGKAITVNGEYARVFEFSDEATAQAEAQRVTPDGFTIGPPSPPGTPGTIVDFEWIAPPHWYQSGKLIVIYVGENQAIMELLESLLGPQFAGM